MNVTQFAEQIVFGKTLEDKLLRPPKLAFDADSVRSTKTLQSLVCRDAVSPGRPVGLEMYDGSSMSTPPRDSELGNEKSRGQLLHFLANHELLATELMALVLLKFPNAPPAFRRGVLVTLQEEQAHTRMYLKRMQECGVEFGSFPLSGHFWRIVEPMRGPLDFVSRLSLTFEQANLDYSLHFAGIFRRLGDISTAKVLEKIYQDEIGHVQHGLQWFRLWKNPEHTDWEAYQDQLTFPMSPQRARGPKCAFNREGRRQAGLTDDFIDSVELFRQSRGRPPTVRWFDPAAEAELAAPLTEKEVPLMQQLGTDLECLMVLLAKQDDIVLVRRQLSNEFRRQLLDAGLELPELLSFDHTNELAERKLNDLQPWPWTPKSYEIAAPMLSATKLKPAAWRDDHVDLFRKSWSARLLRGSLEEVPDWFCTSQAAGTPVSHHHEITAALTQLKHAGHTHALFKQDLSTSGRGQRRLPCRKQLSDQDTAWLSAALGTNSRGVVEPQLDRILDLSFLWNNPGTENTPPSFLAWTRPIVTAGRRYAGTRLHRPFDDCETDVKRFLLADDCGRLHVVREWLEKALVAKLRERGLAGPFGVDAFVYRTKTGELRIKPLVELNPRTTMGHIAMAIRKYVSPVAPAEFRIFSREEWKRTMSVTADTSLIKTSDGRWESGIIPFTEYTDQTKLVAAVIVGEATLQACSD